MIDLLLHNADTLALLVRVLSDIQEARDREGSDVVLPARRAERHAAFNLRQAASRLRHQRDGRELRESLERARRHSWP